MKTNKTIACMALGLLTCCQVTAQMLAEGESAMVYYMPKTQVYLTATVEKVEEQVGIFYQYSERYLGTKDVITENATTYRLVNANVRTRMVADLSRAYKCPLDVNCMPVINSKGILCAINTKPADEPKKTASEEAKKAAQSNRLMPLGEEQMMANSVAKMAESTAKQIYRIRESRLNLLSGEAENMPADGKSLSLMLKELDKREKQLCELFVGKRMVHTEEQSIDITPLSTDDIHEKMVARFSDFAGLVAADDLSGEPVLLSVQVRAQTYVPMRKAAKIPVDAIYYNMPGEANFVMEYGGTRWLDRTIAVAQFGISVPLANELFVKNGVKAVFNPRTGALVSLEK